MTPPIEFRLAADPLVQKLPLVLAKNDGGRSFAAGVFRALLAKARVFRRRPPELVQGLSPGDVPHGPLA